MDDLELLAMAAKAAGYEIEWVRNSGCYYRCEKDASREQWDALDDDGDAFRLAIKLDIHIKRYEGATTCQELLSRKSFTEHDHWSANENDPLKSTRRAIVCAAADIGRRIP